MIQNTPKWRAEGGEARRYNEYNLTEDSLVFDIGGYKGDWTCGMIHKFNCYVHVFEPVHEYAMGIKKRFEDKEKVVVYHYGLSHKNIVCRIALDGDGSTVYKGGVKGETIILKKFSDYLSPPVFIDVVKINIEGGEYDLIDHLVKSGCIMKLGALQIQFHSFIHDADKRVIHARELLSRTHRCTYKYDYVFENWVLK